MTEISPELGEKYQRFGVENSDQLRTTVEERFPSADKKKEQIEQIIAGMKDTLKLERQFPEHPRLDIFYATVAKAIWDACDMLKVPIPSVHLSYSWHDKHALENDNRVASADFVSWRLKLTPRLMNELLDDNYFGYMHMYKLTPIIFHEIYHFWQALIYRNHTQRFMYKNQKIRDQDPQLADGIKSTRKEELAAILFERKAAEHIQTKGLKEFFSKMMALFSRRRQLKEFYQYREEVRQKKAAFDENHKA